MSPKQRSALLAFVASVRSHYGDRLVEVVVFGSRARGDNRADSDIDLAIILEGDDWDYWTEKLWLGGETFWPLVHGDLQIQPFPVRLSAWVEPSLHAKPSFIANLKRDARRVEDAA